MNEENLKEIVQKASSEKKGDRTRSNFIHGTVPVLSSSLTRTRPQPFPAWAQHGSQAKILNQILLEKYVDQICFRNAVGAIDPERWSTVAFWNRRFFFPFRPCVKKKIPLLFQFLAKASFSETCQSTVSREADLGWYCIISLITRAWSSRECIFGM